MEELKTNGSSKSIKMIKLNDRMDEIEQQIKAEMENIKQQQVNWHKELQAYIQTLHMDFDNIEKKRTAEHNEEESKLIRIMDDIGKL